MNGCIFPVSSLLLIELFAYRVDCLAISQPKRKGRLLASPRNRLAITRISLSRPPAPSTLSRHRIPLPRVLRAVNPRSPGRHL